MTKSCEHTKINSCVQSPRRPSVPMMYDKYHQQNTMRSNPGFRSTPDAEEQSDNGMINIESPTHSNNHPGSIKLKELIKANVSSIQRIKYVDNLVFDESLVNKEIPQSTRNTKSDIMVESKVPNRAAFNQTIQNEALTKMKQKCGSESNISLVSVTDLNN